MRAASRLRPLRAEGSSPRSARGGAARGPRARRCGARGAAARGGRAAGAAAAADAPRDARQARPGARPVGAGAAAEGAGPAGRRLGAADAPDSGVLPPDAPALPPDAPALLWRGARDTCLFSALLALAGGPATVREAGASALGATAVALRQAHTHPEVVLFTLSLLPFLAFVRELWGAGRRTRGVTLAFSSLLVFVVVSIPLESYTEGTYGELVSNVDSLHFAAQSLVSGTNLAIVLSLLDATRETRRAEASVARGGEGVGKARRPRAGARSDAALLAALLLAALGGALAIERGGALEQTLAGLQAGGAPVAGPLACVAAPCALAVLALAGAAASDAGAGADADADVDVDVNTGGAALALGLVALGCSLAAGLHPWALAPDALERLGPTPPNALSLATWSVHVLSLLEWGAAMVLVWQYAAVAKQPAFRKLAWAMVPLLGAGAGAVDFHLYWNDPSVEWLLALQGMLTLGGNAACFWAAREIRLEADATRAAQISQTNA